MNSHFFQSSPQPPPSAPPPHGWFPMLPPNPPNSAAFWQAANVRDRSRELKETIYLAEQMHREIDIMMKIKDGKTFNKDVDSTSSDTCVSEFLKHLEDRGISLETQELRTTEAANALMVKLRAQLEPFRCIADETTQWEEKSAAVRLVTKIQKSKRNKLWRKKKRKCVAEMLAKEHERFNQADQEADEWRAREIAKDIAKRKMEKMKEIAKLKAKEERKKLESELELVLIVHKLQELRSVRIQKLKKQGHFLPEEDDKFLERVQAAVEEEERQALAGNHTDAIKEAIASAEETKTITENSEPILKDIISSDKCAINETQKIESEGKRLSIAATDLESKKSAYEGQGSGGGYDSVSNLPMEFYHYYHGSNTDMGTLIEVRRTWDAYIRPGGSRIPGHWVQPPPPADDIWASYLVKTN